MTIAVAGARRHEQYSREKWVADKRIRKQSIQLAQQHEGVVRILNGFCDCLLYLGSEFDINEPNARFSALLLLSSSQTVAGKNFCDFMASEEDQVYFAAILSASQSNGTDSPEMLRIHLKDTQSRSFPVSIHFTSYTQDDGSIGHLIGINEPEERGAPEGDAEDQFMLRTPAALSIGRPPPSVGSSELSTEFASEGAEDFQISFLEDDGFPVCDYSLAMGSLSGPLSQGQDFLECITGEDDRDRLSAWLQRAGNAVSEPFENFRCKFPTSDREYCIGSCKISAVAWDRYSDGLTFTVMFTDVHRLKRKINRRGIDRLSL